MNVAERQNSEQKSIERTPLVIAKRMSALSTADTLSLEAQGIPPLIMDLIARTSALRQANLTKRNLAFEVMECIEQLVRFETKLFSLRYGIDIFLEKLHADPAITSLLRQLYSWARFHVRSVNYNSQILNLPEQVIVNHLQELLEWYVIRHQSFHKLALSDEAGWRGDKIFPLSILHDCEVMGVFGFEVHTGLALFGRAYQQLWLKIFVKEGGKFIKARKGWESWVDEEAVFPETERTEALPFTALLPIAPQSQRAIIDGLSLFIPYAALDIGIGRQEVVIEAALFDESGLRIGAVEATDWLSIPVFGSGGRKILSYQALGIWPADVVRGDAITNLMTRVSVIPQARAASEVVKVTFDLSLASHINEHVMVELRFLAQDGSIIEHRGGDTRQDYVLKQEIFVPDLLCEFCGIELSVPLKDLNLEDVDYACMAEITVLGKQERVLCGAVAALEVPENYRARGVSGVDSEPVSGFRREKLILRENQAISVDTHAAWLAGREKALRFAVVVSDETIRARGGKAVLSLADERGLPLLPQNMPSTVVAARRLPVVARIDGPDLVFVVRHSELFSSAEMQELSCKVNWKVSIYGVDDVLLTQKAGVLAVEGISTAGEKTGGRATGDIVIDDVEACDVHHFPPRRFRAYLSFNRKALNSRQYLLSIDPAVQTLLGGTKVHAGGLVVPLDLSSGYDDDGHYSDWFQSAHVFDCQEMFGKLGVSPERDSIQIKLLAASGDELDSQSRFIMPRLVRKPSDDSRFLSRVKRWGPLSKKS